jgi:hypothetical protein
VVTIMDEEVQSSSERIVEVLEELFTLLRGNNAKLAKGKAIQLSKADEEQDKRFRWYEHSNRGLDFMSMSIPGWQFAC